MNTARLEVKPSIDLKTCSFAEFKEQGRLESTLNLLRHAIQSTVDTTEKTDYLLHEVMHNSKINWPLYDT